MEANTVLLHLQDYEALTEFKRNFKEKNKVVWFARGEVYYYTESEAVKDIAYITVGLKERIQELEAEVLKLKQNKPTKWWQF
jgi:hypothetical protein